LRVLAIDTALEACAAAVLNTDRQGGLTSRSVPMMRGHAEALIPMIAAVMNAAGVKFDALDRIAVTVGPGSFTGLRVGVAAARGIALAAGKPVVGLTTLAALAAPFFDMDHSKALLAAIDARHGHVYMQLFGPGGRALMTPRLATLDDAIRAATASPTRIVGNGAKLIEAAWPADERRPISVNEVRAPDIAWVARLGAAAAETTAGAAGAGATGGAGTTGGAGVRPLYLRGAGAEPQQIGILPQR
jgi:tRNA threonylcarbamoyladenosine biosynthesis protein TsaB